MSRLTKGQMGSSVTIRIDLWPAGSNDPITRASSRERKHGVMIQSHAAPKPKGRFEPFEYDPGALKHDEVEKLRHGSPRYRLVVQANP